MMNRKLNWKPDLPDHRDMKFSLHISPPVTLPVAVDLRAECSPIVDQGDIGSCTGNASAGAVEFMELKEYRNKAAGAAAPEEFGDHKFDSVSRLFIYYNERLIEGDVSTDGGAQIRTAIQALNTYGVCREIIWQYGHPNLFRKPSGAAYAEAKHHKPVSYYRIDNTVITEMKKCLAGGFPIIFGMSVYDSFMSEAAAATGNIPMPATDEQIQGGHALLCVGYDDAKKVFIVRNSWGTSWGDKGYCYIPYDYLTNADLASDFWTIRDIALAAS